MRKKIRERSLILISTFFILLAVGTSIFGLSRLESPVTESKYAVKQETKSSIITLQLELHLWEWIKR